MAPQSMASMYQTVQQPSVQLVPAGSNEQMRLLQQRYSLVYPAMTDQQQVLVQNHPTTEEPEKNLNDPNKLSNTNVSLLLSCIQIYFSHNTILFSNF